MKVVKRTCLVSPGILLLYLFSASAAASAATLSLTSFGAVGDGNAANATANRNAFINALSWSGNTIDVPAGTYMVDNSTIIAIPSFTGQLIFDTNAILVLTNSSGAKGVPDRFGGFYFHNGAGASIQNIHIVWSYPAGTLRDDLVYPAIKISYTSGTTLDGAIIEGSRSAGIQFFGCLNPTVNNANISSSLADGLDFFNDQNVTAINITTLNTGDDGLAFVSEPNTPGYDNYAGGTATNVTVTNSYARGISVVGAHGVTVNNFSVNNTTDSGILVDYEPVYNSPTQIPDQVSFLNGTITNAGQNGPMPASVINPSPARGNGFGVEVNVQPELPTALGTGVTYQNIQIINSASTGFSAVLSTKLATSSLTVTNVYSTGGKTGFNFQVPTASLSNLVSEANQSYGYYIANAGTITAQGLYSIGDSVAPGSLNRAFWVDAPATSIVGASLYVIDMKTVPTGYIVGEGGAAGSLNGIQYWIPHGTFQVDALGGSMTFSNPVSTESLDPPVITGYIAQNTLTHRLRL